MIAEAGIGFHRFLAARRGVSNLRASDIQSIGVIELTRLGDVISMLPAISVLRRGFPSAVITLFVDCKYAGFLSALDLDVHVKGVLASRSAVGFLGCLREIRMSRPDLAFSMSHAKRNVLAALACGAPFCAGYLTSVDSLTPHLISTPVTSYGFELNGEIIPSEKRLRDRSLGICRALGLSPSGMRTRYTVRTETREEIDALLKKQALKSGAPYVVIPPFSGWEFRSWGMENFVRLADAILATGRYEVVFLCSGEETFQLEPTRQKFFNDKRVHYFVSSELLESAVLMADASLFVGNDSGPLQLAAALGVKSIGIFGPASPELTGPGSSDVTCHFVQVDCSPCDQRKCLRPQMPCVNLVSWLDVFDSAAEILGLKDCRKAGIFGNGPSPSAANSASPHGSTSVLPSGSEVSA